MLFDNEMEGELPFPMNVNPLMRKSATFDPGPYPKKPPDPLFVNTVFPMPAPIILTCLVTVMPDDHVADPTLTLIVSPSTAFVTQVLTLETSGVLVQVGLDPVQAAVVTFGGVVTSDCDDPPLPQLDARDIHSAISNNGRRRLTLMESALLFINRIKNFGIPYVHVQRSSHQLGGHLDGHGPARHSAGIEVEHHRQIKPPILWAS